MSETHSQLVYQYQSVLDNSKELLKLMQPLNIPEVFLTGMIRLTNLGFSDINTGEMIRSTKELTDSILKTLNKGHRIEDPMSQINALYDLNVSLKSEIHRLKKRLENDSLYNRDISRDIQNGL